MVSDITKHHDTLKLDVDMTTPYSAAGLYVIYFKRYDTYHDTHEVIFDIYQQYIFSGFRHSALLLLKHYCVTGVTGGGGFERGTQSQFSGGGEHRFCKSSEGGGGADFADENRKASTPTGPQ